MNIIIGMGVALSLSSCASYLSSPNRASTTTISASSAERGIAERVYGLVNQERTRAGKSVLLGHGGLNRLAQRHSDHMGSMSQGANHLGSQNRAHYADLKYNIDNLSEMTFEAPSGSGDPAAAAVAAWKRSSQHRRHMLQSWSLTGIGVKEASNGSTYVTICMGARGKAVPRSIQPIGWH